MEYKNPAPNKIFNRILFFCSSSVASDSLRSFRQSTEICAGDRILYCQGDVQYDLTSFFSSLISFCGTLIW